MEHTAGVSVEEYSHKEKTINTEVEAAVISTAHSNIETDFNHSKQEPGSVRSVKSKPALLVKEAILEEGSQAGNKQQRVQGTTTPAGTDEDCGTSLSDLHNVQHEPSDLLNVKQEPSVLLNVKQESSDLPNVKHEGSDLLNVSDVKTEENMDIGPTVLQHMDIHYTINKQIMSAGTGDKTIVDDGNTAMPCSRVKKDSHEDKLRASRKYSGQKMTEDHYDEAHVKSCLRQEMNFQQHRLHQQQKIRSNSFKHDRIIHKSHLLSTHNKFNMRVHRGEKRHRCDTCDARFAKSGALTNHMRVHTGEKPYQCDMCDKRFAENGALNIHIRVHTGEKPYQCTTCDARFTTSGALTIHMRVHTGEKPYQCTTCDARFAHSGDLTKHMSVHTGESPYQCTTCDARFTRNGGLTRHMRIHTGEKPYQCTTCDARFAHSGNLPKHMRSVHTGERPYQCITCDAKFSQNGALTRHMRVHTGEKPYRCTLCDSRFAYSSGLTRHSKVHTGEKLCAVNAKLSF